MKIQPIGVCRFSLVTEGGFKHQLSSPEDVAAHIFGDRRMGIRMAWFRHVLMPSIRAQTDQDFTFVVLASTVMPQKWQDQLLEAVSGCPAIRLDFVEPGKHWKICNAAFHRYTEPDTDIVAQFRLDDDDALERSYISRVRSDFKQFVAPLYQRFGKVSCDYTRGFILDADSSEARLYRTDSLALTCGQTVYLPPHSRDSLFTWGHHRLHCVMPTVTLNDGNMYLRGRHGTNDTSFRLPKQNIVDWDLSALERRFDIRLEQLQKGLSAVAA